MVDFSLAQSTPASVFDASVPPQEDIGRMRFAGTRGPYWKLMSRGAALEAVTLGIYRFWLFTDMRRFLWANTELDGESFEYTGTAVELLLGFLIAIGILIPVYALLFVASLEMGVFSQLSGIVAFAVLAGFGQYAAYRARRYRLTRTVLRGLRFHQAGSAVAYALRAVLWWILVGLTLGLALPWMEAALERYKMRYTYYGDLAGRFEGTGGRLFLRGIVLWILVVAPIVISFVVAIRIVDWDAVDFGQKLETIEQMTEALSKNDPAMTALGIFFAGIGGSMLLAFLLYPAFQGVVMRWWLAGLRIGTLEAKSDLRIRRYYGAYLRCFLYLVLYTLFLGMVFGMIGGLGYYALRNVIDFSVTSTLRDGVTYGAGVVAYVIYILGGSVIYQVAFKLRIWQAAVDSVSVSNMSALNNVHASEASASAVGEGLADALGGGAI